MIKKTIIQIQQLMYLDLQRDLQICKVVIGHGVTINGEIKKADEVQIDGEADVTMKTDNVVIGATGDCKGNIETHNADIWGKFDGEIKASGTLTIQEQGSCFW